MVAAFHARFLQRQGTFWTSLKHPRQQPGCRRATFQRSTADDIRAAKEAWKQHQKQERLAEANDGAPQATGERAQRQLQDIEQAVQSQLVPNQNADTSTHMSYEDILSRDHPLADEVTDAAPQSNVTEYATAPAQSQTAPAAKKQQPAPPRSAFNSVQQLFTTGSLFQQGVAVLPVVLAGLAGLFVSWHALKLMISCVRSLIHLHTWLMITGVIVTALITPQGIKVNALLRFADDFNLFANYGQAKYAVSIATWSSIAVFLVLVFFAGTL